MKPSKTALFLSSLAINFTARAVLDLTITSLQILTIHIFLFALLFGTDLIQKKLLKKKNASPIILLSINFLRIFLCLVFLFPIMINSKNTPKTYIYNFFFVYFFLLFFDVFWKRKNEIKINR